MTPRERFQRVMHFEAVDRLPAFEMKYYPETVARWRTEGLPADAHPSAFFGDDVRETVPVRHGMVPDPEAETRVIEARNGIVVKENGVGLRTMVYADAPPPHMPRFLRYPVESREDWERVRPRFAPRAEGRVPEDWADLVHRYASREHILELRVGGLFWYLRGLMGPERSLLSFYDDPALVRDMLACFGETALWIADLVTKSVRVDYALFLEDMSYKNGAMFSPAIFRELFTPRYRAVTELLRSRGVDLVFVDTDGNVDGLVPLFREAGIHGLLPMEAAAGADPLDLGRRHGRELLMMGGIDKRAVEAGGVTLEEHLRGRLPRMFRRGGCIPHVDHAVAPNLPFANYVRYRELLRELCGTAEPAERRRR